MPTGNICHDQSAEDSAATEDNNGENCQLVTKMGMDSIVIMDLIVIFYSEIKPVTVNYH